MKQLFVVLVLVAATLTAGCRSMGMHGPDAVATLEPRSGSQVSGTVKFTNVGGNRVRVAVDVGGVAPNSKHGFHVHEKGDCSAPDATSAGGHFNPSGAPHRGRDESPRHAGDFGNVTADAAGRIHDTFDVDAELGDGPDSIIGKALVLHADPDDLQTQPTGNSGARIGCGVINAQ